MKFATAKDKSMTGIVLSYTVLKPFRAWVLILLFGLFTGDAFSQCNDFYDGFESGNWSPTWVDAGGTYTRNVITANPAVGTYCLQQSGSGNHISGLVATFPSAQPNTISWRVRYDATASSGAYFVCGDATLTASDCVTFNYVQGGANIRFFNGIGINTPCVANTWYHIELRNIDWVNRQYDFYINNVLIQAGFGFRSATINSMDRIYLYNIASMTAYYDEILVDGVAIALNPVGTDPACAGDSSGSLSLSPAGGTPQYSFLWDTGDTTAQVTDLPAGTYSVLVTDSNGCTVSDSFMLTSPTPIGDSISFSDPTCNGALDGAVDLSPFGGTPGYAYLWTNGDTTEDLSAIPAGSYGITITDSNGCTFSDSVLLSEPTAIMLMLTPSDLLCNGDSSGTVNLAAAGGTPGYTYLWSTNDTSANISGLSAGWYQVTVTDTMGCTQLDSAFVDAPAALASSGVVTDETSPPGNNGAIDLTVSGGTPGYSFLWSNLAITEDLNGLTSGTYTVEITDGNGCVRVDSFFVSFLVALDNPLSNFGLQAYPNPSNGEIQIDINLPVAAKVGLRLMDLQGRILQAQDLALPGGESKIPLDFSGQASGVYLLRVETGNGAGALMVVKR